MARSIKDLDSNFKESKVTIEEGLVWISAADTRFTVNGLPWFEENDREFIRLPKRAKGVVRDQVWELSTMPSGGRVRFKTDSSTLKLRIRHSRPEVAMVHMCAVGESGIDLYEGPPQKMTYWRSFKQILPQKTYLASYFEKLPRKMRELTLYLPVYNDLVQLDIGLDADSQVAPPSRFRTANPVVFYGTSITQGGCSSRGGNGYVPLVGRTLGIDVVNLGFSGNGKSDLDVAEYIAELDMACFVNDCVGNMSLKLMNERYAAFNQKIRARCPRLPILLMTFIRRAEEQYQPELAKIADDRNAVVFRTFKEFRKRGDRNVHLLECRDLIGFEADHPSVDGAHLSDLGFWRLANEVAPKLKMILNLK